MLTALELFGSDKYHKIVSDIFSAIIANRGSTYPGDAKEAAIAALRAVEILAMEMQQYNTKKDLNLKSCLYGKGS